MFQSSKNIYLSNLIRVTMYVQEKPFNCFVLYFLFFFLSTITLIQNQKYDKI